MGDEPFRPSGGNSTGRVLLGVLAVFAASLRLCLHAGAFASSSDSSVPSVPDDRPGMSGGTCSEAVACAPHHDCLVPNGASDNSLADVPTGTCFHVCNTDSDCTGGQHCSSMGPGQYCAFVADIGASCDQMHVCASGSSCLGLSLGAMSDVLAGRDPTAHDDVLIGECRRQCSADGDCQSGQHCTEIRDGRFCLGDDSTDAGVAATDSGVASDAAVRLPVRVAAHRRHPSEHTPGR